MSEEQISTSSAEQDVSPEERHSEKMRAKRTYRNLAAQIRDLRRQYEAGPWDWEKVWPGIPTEILDHEVGFIFAVAETYYGVRRGAEMAKRWQSASLPLGLLLLLFKWRDEIGLKDEAGIVFMTLKQGFDERKTDYAASWTGIAYDDDNHPALGPSVLERDDGPFRCCFGTASDGKSEDTFPVDSYRSWQLKAGAPTLGNASDGDVEQFLNRDKPGNSGVALKRTPGGFPEMIKIDGEYHARYTMAPHVRSRSVVLFAEPIDGDLLRELISRGLVKKVAEEIEWDIYRVIAHDAKTKRVNAVAFLASGDRVEYRFKLCGKPSLYDAIGAAKRVIEANPIRERPARIAVPTGGYGGGLHGLLLATLIEEQCPELMVSGTCSPIRLRCCPFADGHGTRRGQADGSAYVYDADPERNNGYPYVNCHHDSCSGYSTKDFVNEMIRNGDLPSDVYQDQEYRIELE